MSKFAYGYIKDTPDKRDFKLTIPAALQQAIATCYLNPNMGFKFPPIWDQGNLGSCTAFALAFALMFDLLNNHAEVIAASGYTPSRLFLYYYERFLEGTISQDAGAQIRTGAKVMNSYGVCNDKYWPYDITKFSIQPPPIANLDALNYISISYERITPITKQSLVNVLQSGYPFVFGISCYESFESDQVNETSVVPYPDVNAEAFLGGHAMASIGYHEGIGDDDTFILRNSWGNSWGSHGGYLRTPTRYLLDQNLASDFWVIKVVK